ncbi:uncharacterized protein PV09_07003 [Verruconis gallopava]|uniref:Uncharacterized protein n=1 Tax=Verruconis gallopava TaxID=253628 RepID=A0A0D2A4Y2_9PEZI|nr:uncharacterized protein PV09_07003 [Verruconis gallopava]KIW01525.1 hypothetical protein PV09_07003 [Verruconis gallopava]
MRPHGVFGKQNALSLFALFAFVLTALHFYCSPSQRFGGDGRLLAVPAFGRRKLQRHWSITGRGHLEGVTNFRKPPGLKVVALVFYGRPGSVSILDCYLKRNLAVNGGVLDEVVFLARTRRVRDLLYLDELVRTSPYYRRQDLTFTRGDYRSAYNFVENGTMYVKIDDDIVFMEDSTIPSLVSTKLENPDLYIVSANVVNQPSLSWVHQHLGVVKPYLPELDTPPTFFEYQGAVVSRSHDHHVAGTWRPSELPTWSGPPSFNFTDYFAHHPNGPCPSHRWLPLRNQSNHDNTPITAALYDAFGPSLWHWYIGAQQHFSFLEHLENNELWRYKFHRWDYNYQRMGIQMIAMMGDDINRAKPIVNRDDEYYFSEFMPSVTKRHGVVDGRALAVHYSFAPQKEGMHTTDLLERYRAFAMENICV